MVTPIMKNPLKQNWSLMMAEHIMGPSTVEGFYQQCTVCGALDTEIRFSIGSLCPAGDLAPDMEREIVRMENPTTMTMAQHAACLQAQWFSGFQERQLRKAGIIISN